MKKVCSMNKVLERFDDQLVRGTYMYSSSETEMLYADPGHTVEIKTSVAKELFLKGCLIVFEYPESHKIPNDILKPIRFREYNGIGYLLPVQHNSPGSGSPSDSTSVDLYMEFITSPDEAQ